MNEELKFSTNSLPYSGSINCGSTYEERIPTPSLHEKYEIYVKECLVGYTLSIGCQTIATKNQHEVSAVIDYYLSNKVECQRAYYEGKLDELLKKVLGE
jgi:hypothetical protein